MAEISTLPSPEVLAEAAVEDLEPCRLGYRAKYLIQTAKLVEKEGMDVLEALGQPEVTAEEARQSLCRYSGIGPKVANCISLFSMGKIDSFPIDVWVRKVMKQTLRDRGKKRESHDRLCFKTVLPVWRHCPAVFILLYHS